MLCFEGVTYEAHLPLRENPQRRSVFLRKPESAAGLFGSAQITLKKVSCPGRLEALQPFDLSRAFGYNHQA